MVEALQFPTSGPQSRLNRDQFHPVQEAELTRIRMTSYDRMNGEQVYQDLVANHALWHGAKLVSYVHDHQKESLRALEYGDTFDDTLLISTSRPFKESLEALANGWNADGMAWDRGLEYEDGYVEEPDFQVLSVTWWQDGAGANFEKEKHALKFDLPGGRR